MIIDFWTRQDDALTLAADCDRVTGKAEVDRSKADFSGVISHMPVSGQVLRGRLRTHHQWSSLRKSSFLDGAPSIHAMP